MRRLVDGVAADFAFLYRFAGRQESPNRGYAGLTPASLAVVVDLLGAHPEPTVKAVNATRLPVLVGGGPDELARAVPMLVEAAADATRTDETVTLLELLDAVAAVAPDAIVEAGDRLETVTETAD